MHLSAPATWSTASDSRSRPSPITCGSYARPGLVTTAKRGVWAWYAPDPRGLAWLREIVAGSGHPSHRGGARFGSLGGKCRIAWPRPAESFFVALSYRQASIPGVDKAPDQEGPEMTATSSQPDATSRIKIKETVREKYGDIARDVLQGTVEIGDDPITGGLYSGDEAQVIPLEACKPRSAAATRPRWPSCRPGETVLDLGSGGGIDVLLSARRVGRRLRLRAGHDRRDAGPGRAEPAESRRRERRVPQRARSRPSRCRMTRRRDHLQLRHQSLRRQGPGAARGLPRAAAGRPLRRLRRGGPGRAAGRPARRHGSLGRLRRRRAGGSGSTAACWRKPASATSMSRSLASTTRKSCGRASAVAVAAAPAPAAAMAPPSPGTRAPTRASPPPVGGW